MSSVIHAEPISATSPQTSVEVWFRRVLCVGSVIAGLGLLCSFALLTWARNEFSGPESIVNAQSVMLARDGTLYYDLNSYPHTVSAYTPLFYLLETGLIKVGLPAVTAGRLLSFAALLGIFALIWRLLLLYTRDRYCAWTGVLLGASTSLLLTWGTVCQVDTLAIFWALAAFYQYSRYAINGERTLVWAGVFCGIAFFTKQTTIACPAAIVILLWFQRPKAALQFGATLAAAVLAVALAINAALNGRFLQDTVLANLNPFDLKKFGLHIRYLFAAAGQLILIAAAGIKRVRYGRGFAPFVYLGMALLVFAATAPKIGSDFNYQIESNVLLVLCACLALNALDFFPLTFRGSKNWITLLQIPLAIHLVVNFRITENLLLTRFATEQLFRTQVAGLAPYAADGGRLLSTDFNAMARLRGYIEVEPLIYKLLAGAGVVNPEPLRRDIAAEKFSTIFLFQDVHEHDANLDVEVSTFLPEQTQEIEKHYKLVAQIPGPYLNGIYVYKPASRGAE